MSGPYTPAQQRAAHEAMEVHRQPWRDKGWTVAGGIWGEAAWKHITPDLVVSLCDSRMGLDNEYPDEPVVMWVYRAPFAQGWTIEQGEAPCGLNGDDEAQAEMMTWSTFAVAEQYVHGLWMTFSPDAPPTPHQIAAAEDEAEDARIHQAADIMTEVEALLEAAGLDLPTHHLEHLEDAIMAAIEEKAREAGAVT